MATVLDTCRSFNNAFGMPLSLNGSVLYRLAEYVPEVSVQLYCNETG